MKVAVLGYGVEGRSACRYFVGKGWQVTVFHKERPADLPSGVDFVADARATELPGFDVVVRSPAVRPDSLHTDGRITSVTKEFLREFGTARVIGVTGSKGKGTTASLIHEMLKAAGVRVHLGGNIGVPALDLLADITPSDWVVLEMSSYQLWDLEVSPHVAVLLMIEPEHLDVHTDVDEYVAAKAQIAAHQTADDLLVYLPTNKLTMQAAAAATGRKIPYTRQPGAHVQNDFIVMDEQQIIATGELGVIGRHNAENACAAVTAAWQVTQDVAAMRQALHEFKGLPHRLQLVATAGDVRYYDDSIATTPGSAIAALRAFAAPKVIILGGSDKGAEFDELAVEVARQDMRGVVLIGALRDKIKSALLSAGVNEALVHDLGSSPMHDIVRAAASLGQSGDVVILSPACASFDMFRDYKDRGDQFAVAARQLA